MIKLHLRRLSGRNRTRKRNRHGHNNPKHKIKSIEACCLHPLPQDSRLPEFKKETIPPIHSLVTVMDKVYHRDTLDKNCRHQASLLRWRGNTTLETLRIHLHLRTATQWGRLVSFLQLSALYRLCSLARLQQDRSVMDPNDSIQQVQEHLLEPNDRTLETEDRGCLFFLEINTRTINNLGVHNIKLATVNPPQTSIPTQHIHHIRPMIKEGLASPMTRMGPDTVTNLTLISIHRTALVHNVLPPIGVLGWRPKKPDQKLLERSMLRLCNELSIRRSIDTLPQGLLMPCGIIDTKIKALYGQRADEDDA
ncbi:hypothetical protein DXG01_016327 [Tephrocybe rancida]|nr:hypothetical protein DXG01_016327 [Tephrocybe rancida]